MSKTIDTLVEDIYELFTGSHEADEELLDEFCEAVKGLIKHKLKEACHDSEPTLRMSIIGQPDRKLYYDLTSDTPSESSEVTNPQKFIKFLFGDIVEQLLVYLIQESGHKVAHMQEEVEINGVVGHTDGTVDGIPIDYKTASGWAFRNKFKSKKLLSGSKEDDSFGYKEQLAAYRHELIEKYPDEVDTDRAGWIVFDKESGEILWLEIDPILLIDAPKRVDHLQTMLTKDTPPDNKCYEPKKQGEGGNMVLHNNCARYCPHKFKCWDNLRAFQYSGEIKYFTRVVKTPPRVQEVFIDES